MIWKQYNSHYEVSEYGDVRNIHTKQYLKGHDHEGYLRYCLRYGENRNVFAHKLVAELFLEPNYENKRTINHKDANKRNNHYSNLEYATDKEQYDHANRLGLNDSSLSKLREYNKEQQKPVIGRSETEIVKFDSVSDAIRVYGGVVMDNLRGRCKSAKGFIWEYLNE